MEAAIVSLLRDLGLNGYEAKVLYALFRLREADAKRIAEVAEVPRTKVYEILERLVQEGYIVVKDTRPRLYAVPDPKAVVKRMVREMRERIEKIEKRARQMEEILPILSEREARWGNYIMRFREMEDLIRSLREEISPHAIILSTPESEYVLSRLGKTYRAPIDAIVDGDRAYLPLHPLHEPAREIVVVVFREPPYVDILRRWAERVKAEQA